MKKKPLNKYNARKDNYMKRYIFALILTALTFMSYALDINNPADRLYFDLEIWQEKGYYRHIPEIRPYPAQLLIELLDKVIVKGDYLDKQIASVYRDKIAKPLNLEVEAEAETRYGRDEIGETNGTLNFMIKGIISESVSVWGNVSANAILRFDNPDYYMYYNTLPYGERTEENWVEDTGTIAGISLFSGSAGMMGLGSSTLYGNLGLTRASFGPFYDDGIVISEEADEQGHYELTWRGDDFSYSILFLSLVGTDFQGNDSFPEKYLAMHSYNWAPFDWLDVGFFETNVWGNRFEPLYMLPFSYLFYNQGVIGFDDNSLMGLKFRTLLPERVELNGVLYVDDVGFNDLIKFNFDTKLKLAFEAGASWTPADEKLYKISLDYTAVLPYMYTHYPWLWNDGHVYNDPDFYGNPFYETMNASNYTHNGENLGTTLSPNSDRISLTSNWRLDEDTQVTLTGNFVRHGNASSEKVDDAAEQDGSIWDNGNDVNGVNTVFNNDFLNQDVLEMVLQAGVEFNAIVDMPFKDPVRYYGTEFTLGYTFERIWNSGRGSNGNPVAGADELNHYVTFQMRVFF